MQLSLFGVLAMNKNEFFFLKVPIIIREFPKKSQENRDRLFFCAYGKKVFKF